MGDGGWGSGLGGRSVGGGGGGGGGVPCSPPPPLPAKQKSGVAEPKTNSLHPVRFGAEPNNTFTNVFDNTYDIGDFRAHYAGE